MKVKATFKENNMKFSPTFKEAYVATGGGMEEVYQRGFAEGQAEGYEHGKADEYKRLFNAMVDGSEPIGDIVIDAETIKANCFSGNKNITGVEMTKVKDVGNMAFYVCSNITFVILPDTLDSLGTNVFGYNSNLASVTFKGTPSSIAANCFAGCNKLLDIYVPWSEGEVVDAPWGATKSNIHYNSEVV